MHLFLVILPPHGKYINEVKDLKCLVCGKEFNEKRWFKEGSHTNLKHISVNGCNYPFGNLIFSRRTQQLNTFEPNFVMLSPRSIDVIL